MKPEQMIIVMAPLSLPVLSEWSDGSVCSGLSTQQPAAPALRYVSDGVLQGWCTQAQWMEEALGELRDHLGPQLQRHDLQARGRALGAWHVALNPGFDEQLCSPSPFRLLRTCFFLFKVISCGRTWAWRSFGHPKI